MNLNIKNIVSSSVRSRIVKAGAYQVTLSEGASAKH